MHHVCFLPRIDGVESLSEILMAKAFTYSRLPEHQVAVYLDEHDKTGKRFLEMGAASKNCIERTAVKSSQMLAACN